MSLKINSNQIKKIIFFLMMWVFYSLNSRYFKVPMATTLRWLLLGLLIFTVIFSSYGKIHRPPAIIAFYLISVFPSIFASVDKTESVIKILSFLVVVWGSYIYFSSLKTVSDLTPIMKIVMVIMILFEIQSLLCLFLGIGYMGDRATGITTNSNTLGIYSNVALLASFYLSEHAKGMKKVVLWVLMFFSAATAIASGSRTAFVTLLLNLAIILFFKVHGMLRIVLIIVLGICAYMLLGGYFSFLNIRALNGLLAEGGMTRGALWDKGVEVWRKFPVFGCGYAVSQTYNNLPGLEGYPFHNSYLTYLAETGIWGMGIMGATFIGEFRKNLGYFTKSIKGNKISLLQISCVMLVELMIAAWSESFLFAVGSTEACTFWVIFMWIIAYREGIQIKKREEKI